MANDKSRSNMIEESLDKEIYLQESPITYTDNRVPFTDSKVNLGALLNMPAEMPDRVYVERAIKKISNMYNHGKVHKIQPLLVSLGVEKRNTPIVYLATKKVSVLFKKSNFKENEYKTFLDVNEDKIHEKVIRTDNLEIRLYGLLPNEDKTDSKPLGISPLEPFKYKDKPVPLDPLDNSAQELFGLVYPDGPEEQ